MNDYTLMSKVFDMCRGIALLLLDYYRIILICNMVDATGGEGHVYPSGVPDVTPVFFLWKFIFARAFSV